MNQKRITFRLVGGLGNQLFQIAAALSMAQKVGAEEVRALRIGFANHYSLEKLNFPNKLQIKKASNFEVLNWNLKNFLTNRLKLDNIAALMGAYKSTEVGFQALPQRFHSRRNLYVFGYFQSWRYCKPDSMILGLKTESPWLRKLTVELEQSNPIVIHIRLGDYVQAKHVFGLLSTDYYLNALKLFPASTENNPVWVFSNDIPAAKEYFEEMSGQYYRYINEPEDSDPIEILTLMSRASKIVIANSTFSWWAAWLGNREKVVVAPIPWYMNTREPKDLIPNTWNRIQATWKS